MRTQFLKGIVITNMVIFAAYFGRHKNYRNSSLLVAQVFGTLTSVGILTPNFIKPVINVHLANKVVPIDILADEDLNGNSTTSDLGRNTSLVNDIVLYGYCR